jgi:sporulation integral membrane protein YlbJ
MKPTKKTNSKPHFYNIFKNSTFLDCILTLLIFAIMLIIISNPQKYTSGTISGIKLFFFSVLPGLFPFMFLTKLITELGFIFKVTKKLDKVSYKIFGTSGISLYAFFMSILSGYPIGAKIISDLYEKGLISEVEAKKMSIFCTTSGPIFVIGTVGTIMFNNFSYGIILYVSHILSSVILGILFNLFSGKDKEQAHQQKSLDGITLTKQSSNIIADCLSDTVNSLFTVGAYITLFFLVTEILESLKFFVFLSNLISPVLKILNLSSSYLQGFLYGLIEVTRGAKTLSYFGDITSLVLVAGIISFSGISIIMQSMAFLKKAKIKMHEFVFAKFMHMILSMILCFLILVLFV